MDKKALIQALKPTESIAEKAGISGMYVQNLRDILERITNRLEQTTKSYLTISFDSLDFDFVQLAFRHVGVSYTTRLTHGRIEMTLKF